MSLKKKAVWGACTIELPVEKEWEGFRYDFKQLWESLISVLQGAESDDSISFKDMYEGYQAFCVNEGHRKPYPKKEFREILKGEGYAVRNCTRHANQVRVFGAKNEEVAVV